MTSGATPAAIPVREPLDLRLASGAAAGWLAVLSCGSGAAGRALLVGVAAAVLAAALLLGARRWRATAALALVLFCVALVLLPLAERIMHARAAPLFQLARRHTRVSATLTVTADPVPLAAKGVAGAPRVAVETAAESLAFAGGHASTDGTVLVLGDAAGWRDVLPGQRVRVDGTLQPDLHGSSLSVTLFSRAPPERLGVPPWWQRLAGRIRTALRGAAAGLPDQERGLLPGLVDGDTSRLDPVLTERFRMAGLTHLLAVSGTNCSIVVGAALLMLRRLRARPWFAAVVGGLVLLLFVIVARPSPSVLRAALMASIALVSLATGRPRAALPGLSAAVLALLLWQPTLAGSASFAMSVLATASLLLIAPGWAAALRRRRVPAGLAEAVAVAAAAHLVTAPVVAALSGRVSLVAVPANVLAEPVVAVITVLGFAAAVVAPVWSAAGRLLAELAGWPCRWLVFDADHFGGLHGATVAWPGGLVGGLLLLATLGIVGACALRAGARRVLGAAAATALVIFIPVRSATSGWPPSGWVFAACDVGQGDALLLPAGPGAAVEVDAGPDPVAIDRCLRDFGIHRIALLVLTHYHLDHVGGLPGVVRGRAIDRVLAGPLADPEFGASIVHRELTARGLPVISPPVGTHLVVGAVRLDVLGPPAAFHGTRSDPNNSSLVLRAVVDGLRILLPGDAEVAAQRWLLGSGADLRADILKVPHHGSAYSDGNFLSAVHAQLGVISVGAHNDYGHPSPLLLTALARLGVPVFRTDRDGDIAIVARGGHLTAVVRGVAASTIGLRPPATLGGHARRATRAPPPAARGGAPADRVTCSVSSSTPTSARWARPTRCPPRARAIAGRVAALHPRRARDLVGRCDGRHPGPPGCRPRRQAVIG
jgi:competence protein ComEC